MSNAKFDIELAAERPRLLYLARHGQAGGSDYNQLTEKGREQAGLLGKYLADSSIDFDFIACGTLGRQRETLEICREMLQKGERRMIEPVELPGLDEIAPDIWYTLAEELRRRDKSFRQEFHAWIAALRKRDRSNPTIYARAMKRLLAMWITEDYQSSHIASFKEYHKGVLSIPASLPQQDSIQKILLISSGTPISLLMGSALRWELEPSLGLLRWIRNTSLSIFSIGGRGGGGGGGGRWEPVSLNGLPHLPPGESGTII